jgi:hypothetical protein
MLNRPITLNILLGILAITLLVPLSPSVSSAKAKMCCKKNCRSMMMGTAPQSFPDPVKHCSHKKDSVQCCEENCSRIITYKNPEPYSFIGVRKGLESSPENISLPVLHSSIQLSEFYLRDRGASFLFSFQDPPIYLSNAILRI